MTDSSLLKQQEQSLATESKMDSAGTKESPVNNGNGSTATSASSPAPTAAASAGFQQTIGTKPTLVEKSPMRFLIMDAPRQSNLPFYIREMKKHNVTHVVRVCEPTYMPGSEFSTAGICLHEMEYKDGTSPSRDLILSWLRLVESTFFNNSSAAGGSTGPCIAVHCVAGLGRAPVMVAIALVEFCGMDPVEAVSFIRSKRRGAINEKQLLYLSGYKKIYKNSNASSGGCNCVIM